FYVLAQVNNGNLSASMPTYSMDVIDINQTSMSRFRNNSAAADTYVNNAGPGGNSNGANQYGGWNGIYQSAFASSKGSFQSLGPSGGGGIANPGSASASVNPIIQMQQAGFALLLI